MVWLDVTGNHGNALYFVTEKLERLKGRGAAATAVYGLIGDGEYEGQVLIEIGAKAEVTFVDAWLAADEFHRFGQRVDLDGVVAALIGEVSGLVATVHGHAGGVRSGYAVRSREEKVAEDPPVWVALA